MWLAERPDCDWESLLPGSSDPRTQPTPLTPARYTETIGAGRHSAVTPTTAFTR